MMIKINDGDDDHHHDGGGGGPLVLSHFHSSDSWSHDSHSFLHLTVSRTSKRGRRFQASLPFNQLKTKMEAGKTKKTVKMIWLNLFRKWYTTITPSYRDIYSRKHYQKYPIKRNQPIPWDCRGPCPSTENSPGRLDWKAAGDGRSQLSPWITPWKRWDSPFDTVIQ